MLESLTGEARKRLLRAYAPKSKGTLQSAIRKLAAFARHIPSSRREMFMRSKFAGDKAAANHNEWTFILFVEWLLVDISKKTGKPVQSSTIESYVSLLKGYLLFSYDFETPAQSPRLSRLIALIRSEDPMAGIRSKRHRLPQATLQGAVEEGRTALRRWGRRVHQAGSAGYGMDMPGARRRAVHLEIF